MHDNLIFLEYFLVILSIYLVVIKNNLIFAAVFLALSVYSSPHSVIFVSVSAAYFYKKEGFQRGYFLFFLLQAALCLGILVFVSFQLIGDFTWIERCYSSHFWVDNPQHALGFVYDISLSV